MTEHVFAGLLAFLYVAGIVAIAIGYSKSGQK